MAITAVNIQSTIRPIEKKRMKKKIRKSKKKASKKE